MADIERTLAKFKIKSRRGDRIQAYCPSHDDKNASLSILFSDNKLLLYCHAGCKVEDILKAADLTFSDLFTGDKPPVAIYQYRNTDGSLSHEKLKYQTPKGKRFTQRRIEGDAIVDNLDGIPRIPYNYPKVLEAQKQNSIILYTEGEKDADTAELLGYVGTTMGGASDWREEYKHFFKNSTLVIIPDKDSAGTAQASKIAKSLGEVCKSLKVLILPEGKDLTEWVEKGNHELSPLITEAQEIIPVFNILAPKITSTYNGFIFSWSNLNLTVRIDNLSDDATGIIRVAEGGNTLHISNINLLSTRSLAELANRLRKHKKIDWDAVLSKIATYCADKIGEAGTEENINIEPVSMKIDYLLDPLLPMNEPVTIYTAGGKGKSIFADYIAVLVQFGIAADGNLPFIPRQCNVLYLDWEADAETHRRYITAIKRGLNVEFVQDIKYLKIDRPLCKVMDTVRSMVKRHNIGLTIIDSQMAATASGSPGLTEAQIASEYYNNIHSLKCTTLTIDHITKQGMLSSNGIEAPYGSVVKYNRSRSQFELRLPDEEEDSDHKEFALIHRKFNLGRKQKPLGIAVDFTNNDNELVEISFRNCSIKDNPLLEKVLRLPVRIKNLLVSRGSMTVKDIAEQLDETEASVRARLNENKNMFIKLENNEWGVQE